MNKMLDVMNIGDKPIACMIIVTETIRIPLLVHNSKDYNNSLRNERDDQGVLTH